MNNPTPKEVRTIVGVVYVRCIGPDSLLIDAPRHLAGLAPSTLELERGYYVAELRFVPVEVPERPIE